MKPRLKTPPIPTTSSSSPGHRLHGRCGPRTDGAGWIQHRKIKPFNHKRHEETRRGFRNGALFTCIFTTEGTEEHRGKTGFEQRVQYGQGKPLTTKDTKEHKGGFRDGALFYMYFHHSGHRGSNRARFEQRVQYGNIKPFNHKGHEETRRGLQKWSPFLHVFSPQGAQRSTEAQPCAVRAMCSLRERKTL